MVVVWSKLSQDDIGLNGSGCHRNKGCRLLNWQGRSYRFGTRFPAFLSWQCSVYFRAALINQLGSWLWGGVMPFISAHADHSSCHWSCTAAYLCACGKMHWLYLKRQDNVCLVWRWKCCHPIRVVRLSKESMLYILFACCLHAYYRNQGFPHNSFMWSFKMGSSKCSNWLKMTL